MAKVGAQRAAVLTGKSKSTVQRAMNSGKLSYELDANQRRVIDVSELERVFGIQKQNVSESKPAKAAMTQVTSAEIEAAVEKERLTMQIKMLEQQLSTSNERIDDLMDQRDKWEKQASQVLITSQYSQKQAEELRAQIKEREERARQRRLQNAKVQTAQKNFSKPTGQAAKNLDSRMNSLKAENENVTESSSVFRFWKKARG
ncbi:MAG: entry exclusion 1 domain-containing protein [Alphaproteobacteria bacterium]